MAQVSQLLPKWICCLLGLDDLSEAYRHDPIVPEQRSAAVVGVYSRKKGCYVFAVFCGCTYGWLSAVLIFNRLPTLAVAAARHFFACLSSAYFDDNLTMDFVAGGGGGQRAVQQVYADFGAP